MSLQDDVFDVEEAVKDLPEAKAFDRIIARLWAYEEELDELRPKLNTIRAFKRLMEEDNDD